MCFNNYFYFMVGPVAFLIEIRYKFKTPFPKGTECTYNLTVCVLIVCVGYSLEILPISVTHRLYVQYV